MTKLLYREEADRQVLHEHDHEENTFKNLCGFLFKCSFLCFESRDQKSQMRYRHHFSVCKPFVFRSFLPFDNHFAN